MGRFQLDPKNYHKLTTLIKEREYSLADIYHQIIGEWPPSVGEVHHVKHRSAFGPDKAENLIFLSTNFHIWKLHRGSYNSAKDCERRINEYMNTREVKEWNERHSEELEEIYKTEPDAEIERIRRKYRRKKHS